MRPALAISLIFLFTAQADGWAYWPFNSYWNPYYPGYNMAPFGHFPGRIFQDDWWRHLQETIDNTFKSAHSSGVSISIDNGNMTVTADINGKRYNATFPGATSISTAKSCTYVDGKYTEEFCISVNNETYVYKTVDGKTTVTSSGTGQTVRDPFQVTSIESTTPVPRLGVN
nr:hypothetical protein HCOI_02028100 [Haemonchus contortus]